MRRGGGYAFNDPVHHRLHRRDLLLRRRAVRGLGDDAHDRLGVARAGVDPARRSQSMRMPSCVSTFSLANSFFSASTARFGVLAAALELRLDDLVARQLGDELADRLAGRRP